MTIHLRRPRRHTAVTRYVDVVFTAPPGGPDDPPAVFVELEDDEGRSISLGEWVRCYDGYWALRIPLPSPLAGS